MKKILCVLTALITLLSGCTGGGTADSYMSAAEELSAAVSARIDELDEVSAVEKSWSYFALAVTDGSRNTEYIAAAESYDFAGASCSLLSKAVITLASMGRRADELAAAVDGAADKTAYLTSAAFALIALDSWGYEGDRAVLTERIASAQNEDGSFGGNADDIDSAAMALIALAPYAEYGSEIALGISFLSEKQTADGGFEAYGVANSNTTAQVIIALTSNGVDPATDERFEKEGGNPVDFLLSLKHGGYVKYSAADAETDIRRHMATEQSAAALVAMSKFKKGARLYDFSAPSAIISVDCKTILQNSEAQAEARKTFGENYDAVIPSDGYILSPSRCELEEGVTVMDLLTGVLKGRGMIFDVQNSVTGKYVKSVANLGEMDCGGESGWVYLVNGKLPGVSADRYIPKAGDVIEWRYTCAAGDVL